MGMGGSPATIGRHYFCESSMLIRGIRMVTGCKPTLKPTDQRSTVPLQVLHLDLAVNTAPGKIVLGPSPALPRAHCGAGRVLHLEPVGRSFFKLNRPALDQRSRVTFPCGG